MANPPAFLDVTCDYEEKIAEGEGTVIGPYTLREQIGEGGMGLVFVAEQTDPVRRKVALKVIKPGMDSKQFVARFEAERQALALMDHPHIAKVLDAGTTSSGLPYFVMELVRGVPITEYADANKFTPHQRLELFVQVCHAVQHAHQKGIIHRDLKPSNILVTSHDGVPVVKVIDFGVAKAVGQTLTEKTIYTRFAQMIGTPLYMSPEQAEFNGLDVDTRSDVYALGVVLYELLTGTTPFDGERFRKAAYDEMRRIIKEEEPPRPSTRLTSLGATLTAVSAKRGTDPGKLAGVVRGELDWIVMRCLEKDRTRRYDGAAALVKDVQRYLTGDAVEACPPTLGYRVRKAYRRNRNPILIGAAFVLLLTLGSLATTILAISAWRAEAEARANAEKANVAQADAEKVSIEAKQLAETQRLTRYAAEMNLLQAAHLEKDLARVRKLLLAQIPSPGEPDLRGPEWHYWNRKFHEHEDLLSFSCLRSKSKYAADFSNTGTLSPDGVTAAYSLDDGQGGQTFQIWDLLVRRQLKSFTLPAKRKPKQESLISVKFSQDGNRLAITRTGFNSGVAETKSDIQYWILDWRQDTNPRLLDEKLDVDQWLGDSSFSEDLVYAVEYLINKKERKTRMVIRRTDDFANVYEVTVPGDASAQLCANGTHLLVLSYLENYKFGDDVNSNSPIVSTVISYHKLGTAEPIWRQEFKSRQGFGFHQTIKLSGDQYHRLLLEGNNWVLRTSDIATNKLIRTRTIAPRSEVGQEFGDLDSPAFSWELSRDGQRLLFPTRYGLAVSDLDHQFSNFPQGLVPVKYDWQFLNCVPFSFGFLADGRVAAIWAPGNNGAFNLSRDPADKSRLITRVWSPPAYGSRVDEGVNLASTRDGKQYAFLGRRRPAGQKKTEVVLYVVGEPDGCTFQTVLDNLSSGDATNREVPAQGFLPPFLPMAGISA